MTQLETHDLLLNICGIPDESNVMYSADGKHLVGCRNCLLVNYIVKDGCEDLSENAFRDCFLLQSIILPESLKSIGSRSFDGCKSLRNINIPDSVTSIGYHAFANCTSLKYLSLPLSLRRLGTGCFAQSGLQALESRSPRFHQQDGFITDTYRRSLLAYIPSNKICAVPEEIINIEHEAFAPCGKNLTQCVSLPASIRQITGNPFLRSNIVQCESQSSRFVTSHNCLIDKSIGKLIAYFGNNVEFRIPADTIAIGIGAFFRNPNLMHVSTPDSLKEIGCCTFAECSQLKLFDPSPNITKIGCAAFASCRQLLPFRIPEFVTEIKSHTFEMCKTLNKLLLPKNLEFIGNWAFAGCDHIPDITLPNGLKSIGYMAFAYCSGAKKARIPPSVIHIGSHAFTACVDLQSIALPHFSQKNKSILSMCNNLKDVNYKS